MPTMRLVLAVAAPFLLHGCVLPTLPVSIPADLDRVRNDPDAFAQTFTTLSEFQDATTASDTLDARLTGCWGAFLEFPHQLRLATGIAEAETLFIDFASGEMIRRGINLGGALDGAILVSIGDFRLDSEERLVFTVRRYETSGIGGIQTPYTPAEPVEQPVRAILRGDVLLFEYSTTDRLGQRIFYHRLECP